MSEKFRNKYRIPSARWQSWDYSAEGLYFITICTTHGACLFGDIRDEEMYLSDIGRIVNEEWDKSFDMRKELFCDIFQIMPNHIHAILRIENPVQTHGRASQNLNQNLNPDNPDNGNFSHEKSDDFSAFDFETHGRASLQPGNGVAYRPKKSISSFAGGFKSAATVRINDLRHTPHHSVWLPRFHDHVIRDHDEYLRIYHYIETNVANWHKDCFYLK